ncbi:hypothetical protein SUGI_0820300 [Cryptomeria japonica]|nr:hypothetical protein SUGI_0820300 [Cryptomeria japonica]
MEPLSPIVVDAIVRLGWKSEDLALHGFEHIFDDLPYFRGKTSLRVLSSSQNQFFSNTGESSSKLVGVDITLNVKCSSKVSLIPATKVELVAEERTEAPKERNGGIHGKLNKVILAYSDLLDMSMILPWLRKNSGYDVIYFTGDIGQGLGENEWTCNGEIFFSKNLKNCGEFVNIFRRVSKDLISGLLGDIKSTIRDTTSLIRCVQLSPHEFNNLYVSIDDHGCMWCDNN